jgi:2-amino-4-hydroxy-6-hydroxymethyldihydropteridine diphosphokinase
VLELSAGAENRIALIALGSNLGDSVSTIRKVFERFKALSPEPIKTSSLWQTAPVNCPPGSPPFVNAAVAMVPARDETPESLLEKLQAIEVEFGRRPKVVFNEARPLDLDLIAFGVETRNTGRLTLPHPRAHLRRFVLAPCAEVAPTLILPGQRDPIQKLLATLVSTEQTARILPPCK